MLELNLELRALMLVLSELQKVSATTETKPKIQSERNGKMLLITNGVLGKVNKYSYKNWQVINH